MENCKNSSWRKEGYVHQIDGKGPHKSTQLHHQQEGKLNRTSLLSLKLRLHWLSIIRPPKTQTSLYIYCSPRIIKNRINTELKGRIITIFK